MLTRRSSRMRGPNGFLRLFLSVFVGVIRRVFGDKSHAVKNVSCFFLVAALSFAVSACDPATDYRYRTQGVGLSLYNEQTKRNTENLNKYFQSLCLQAGYSMNKCAPGGDSNPANYPKWGILVETGYNDIDFKCDSYLSWIDGKRTEKLFVDRSTIALGTLLGGTLAVASAGQDAIAYVALALGFVSNVYDGYQNSLLLGLEGSTIKEIVNQRRLLHREQFKTRRYINRPEAVFALRKYLTYCTPQSILTDVNSFSRDGVLGNTGTALRAAQRNAQLLPTSNSLAGPTTRRDPAALPTTPEIFKGPGFGKEHVMALQKASCVAQDGKPGKDTKFAIYILEQAISGFDKDGKISGTEWPLVLQTECNSAFKNYYESITFGPDGGADFGKNIVIQLAVGGHIKSDLSGKTLADKDVRSAIASLRDDLKAKGKFDEGEQIDEKRKDQITPKLLNHLYPETYKLPQ
jgi:hypothetical protein